jgi:hypothetical protein
MRETNYTYYAKCTDNSEGYRRVISTPASYTEGPWFKSRPGNPLSWLKFSVVFLNPSRQVLEQYLKADNDRFLRVAFQFVPQQ